MPLKVVRILVSMVAAWSILIAGMKGQMYERKNHGIRSELAAHLVGSFVVRSKRACGSECSKKNCELMLYSDSTRSCTLYDTYMSDDQPALQGLYAKVGAVDNTPCPPVAPPSGASVSYGSPSSSTIGSKLTYDCNDGYQKVRGDNVRTCKTGGVWSGSAIVCEAKRHIKTLSVTNGGTKGSWGSPEYCTVGTYVYGYNLKRWNAIIPMNNYNGVCPINSAQTGIGTYAGTARYEVVLRSHRASTTTATAPDYQQKIEPKQSPSSDNTAVNAIKFRCVNLHRYQSGDDITSKEGPHGEYQHSAKSCPSSLFMVAFALQVQEGQANADNTSVNFVKIKCRDFNASGQASEVALAPGYGEWGTWGPWSDECGPQSAVCGLRTRIHFAAFQEDRTSLNDLEVFCCP